MHGARLHQWEEGDATSAIWLLAGTGEGPKLAQALLEQGWRLLVSVVSPEAARAYSPHPRTEAGASERLSSPSPKPP